METTKLYNMFASWRCARTLSLLGLAFVRILERRSNCLIRNYLSLNIPFAAYEIGSIKWNPL
jgi:hypothetical protein